MGCRTVILPLLVWSAAYAQTSLNIVNSASGATTVAADSAASAFGTQLSSTTAYATFLPLPTTLAGMSIDVTDASGTVRAAGLILVSPTQVNFILPSGTATGTATVTLRNGSNTVATGNTLVQTTAPGIFTANGNGTGVAAAIAIVLVDVVGPQHVYPIFQCTGNSQPCTPVPVTLGVDTPVFLALFGTGIHSGKNVSVTIGSQTVPVLYAGSQGAFPGLDQINVAIPLTLRGAGLTNVVVTVDGQASNPAQVLIQ
jgi:uncharacterized protein (TIGR03437 family)